MNIATAFCVELDKEVDIWEASDEYFKLPENTKKKFTFLCSDPKCREHNTRVIGVSYTQLPEAENPAYVSPYFRKHPTDEHIDDCIWKIIDKKQSSKVLGDAPARSKAISGIVARHIAKFNFLQNLNRSRVVNQQSQLKSFNLTSDSDFSERERIANEYQRRFGSSTSKLEDLVSYFDELQLKDMLHEEIEIQGHGTLTYRSLFTHIKNTSDNNFTVWYGGAIVSKPYGQGFLLNFFDKIDGFPIKLYVSKDDLYNYKLASRLTQIVKIVYDAKDLEIRPYLKVFFIGHVEFNSDKKCFDAKIHHPKYLVLRLIYPKKS